jgi:hypothetical protein
VLHGIKIHFYVIKTRHIYICAIHIKNSMQNQY